MIKVQNRKAYLKILVSAPLVIGAIFLASNAFSADLKMSQSLSINKSTQKQPKKSIVNRVSESVSDGVGRVIDVATDWVTNEPSDSQYSLVQGWSTRAIEQTKSLLGKLPSPEVPFEIREGGTGLNIPTGKSSHLAVGNLNSQYGQFHESDQTGIHWVNKMDQDTSFYMGIQRNSGDAKETTSGVGFIYDLN